jgi:Helix-turn-helix domain
MKEIKQPEIVAVPVFTPSSVPVHNWRAHWLTTQEFARMLGRSHWTIYTWIRNGTLAEFGVPTYQLRSGRLHSGRTFIRNIY